MNHYMQKAFDDLASAARLVVDSKGEYDLDWLLETVIEAERCIAHRRTQTHRPSKGPRSKGVRYAKKETA